MLRILYDDFDQKVKNIHDEMDLRHSYKKKSVYCLVCSKCVSFYNSCCRMFTSAIKKQTSVCCYISLNPYIYGISNLESRTKKEKGKQFYC